MATAIIDKPGYRLIRVSGMLDGLTAESQEFEKRLLECEAAPAQNHVLDLSAVDYVNSSTLGVFVRLLGAVQDKGFQVLILNPPSSVRSVLDLTGLSALLPVVRDEAALQAALQRPSAAKVASRDVDYDALSREIDQVAQKGAPPPDRKASELRKLLGKQKP